MSLIGTIHLAHSALTERSNDLVIAESWASDQRHTGLTDSIPTKRWRLISLLRAIRVERPHEQFIQLKVVASGVGLERAPKVSRDP
jgi:hypothetical protein